MPRYLTEYQKQILSVLAEDGGFLTRRVTVAVRGNANLRHDSQMVRRELLELKHHGLVRELDNQKPVCWCRTAAGTASLAQGIVTGTAETRSGSGSEQRERVEPGPAEQDAPTSSVSSPLRRRAFYAISKPTFWQRLGFGECSEHWMEDVEGYAPAYLATSTITFLDWRDRLRVLISGKVMTASATKTDVVVARATTKSRFSVLPPNYRSPSPAPQERT